MSSWDAPVWALGLMSGTSLDGIDGAALLTDGDAILGFGPKRFEPYPDDTRARLRAGFGQFDPAEDLSALVTEAHIEMARYFPTTQVIGFHGQTLAHDPAGFATHQTGDGAALARGAGQTVVWDFRTADVLSGGQGAPLVPFFHHACARMLGLTQVTAFVNIGGVANVTWVDPRVAQPEAPGALLAFDTGPGNALIDDLMAARTGASRDDGGAMAATGTPDMALVAQILADPYFAIVPPKSLDRNHFHRVLDLLSTVETADALATLSALTAASLAAAVRHMPEPPTSWVVAGGGRHNRTIMAMLAQQTNAPVDPVEMIGLDGDYLEAQAFAYLALRVLRGLPTSSPDTTGARLPVSGGRVSCPTP